MPLRWGRRGRRGVQRGGAWEDWELGGRWRVWRGRRRCEGGGAVREAAVTVVEARAAVTVEVEETGTA